MLIAGKQSNTNKHTGYRSGRWSAVVRGVLVVDRSKPPLGICSNKLDERKNEVTTTHRGIRTLRRRSKIDIEPAPPPPPCIITSSRYILTRRSLITERTESVLGTRRGYQDSCRNQQRSDQRLHTWGQTSKSFNLKKIQLFTFHDDIYFASRISYRLSYFFYIHDEIFNWKTLAALSRPGCVQPVQLCHFTLITSVGAKNNLQ